MKIVFLNTWGGRVTDPLIQFFKDNQDVDVFCLQEVHTSINNNSSDQAQWTDQCYDSLEKIREILIDYRVFMRPYLSDYFGLAIFIKKNINIMKEGELFVHKHAGYVPVGDVGNQARNIQYVTLKINESTLTLVNFHGLWNGNGKDDTEDRLKQSENIISFLKTLDHQYILGGDFNLSPDTKSLHMFEDFGMRNLIKEYDITSTRTSFYTKENKFADYVFVSRGVTVQDFKVLPDEVSDHAPLCVTIVA